MFTELLKIKNYKIKIIFSLVFLFFTFNVNNVSAAIIAKPSNLLTLNTGLLGYWTFDGKNMITNVADSSGQGKNAVMAGFTSTSSAQTVGIVGQALSFDGVNDSINTTLDFFGLTSFTVSQWVYAKNPDQYDSLWGADGSAAGCFNGDGVYFSGPTTLNFRAAGVGDDAVTVPNIKNKWTHVVSTYNATNRRVYFDNVLVYNQAGGAATTGDVDFQVGSYNDCIASPNENFEGYIDDVRVYNRVLSTNEIRSLYNSSNSKFARTPNGGNPSLSPGLVGHWTFDGKNMISNVADSSGRGNKGNLSGQTSTSTTAGKIGQALNFDGNDDIITISSDFIGTSDITTTVWIKINSYGGSTLGTIITNGAYIFRVRGGGNNNLDYRANNNTQSATDANSILTGRWYFVAVTRSGTTVNFYIDGTQSGTPNQTNESPGTGSSVAIGNRTGNDQGFDGSMDDLRVYNRVLTANEIKQLYNIGK